MQIYDLIIIGGGPAGLTAAIYGARGGRKTLLFERESFGGQVAKTNFIENYPGFSSGIKGIELAEKMLDQAKRFGVEILVDEVIGICSVGACPQPYKIIKTREYEYQAKSIIIATGSKPKELSIPKERELVGRGISYCAVCDGPLFRNKVLGVVGGGDSAIGEALFLKNLAQKVYIIHRRDDFRAVKALKDRVLTTSGIEIIWNSIVHEIKSEGQMLTGVVVRNLKTSETKEIRLDGLFVYIGFIPNTGFVKDLLKLDEEGYIITNEDLATEIPGIFAAGDVRKKNLYQISTAVGDGALAAFNAEKYLSQFAK